MKLPVRIFLERISLIVLLLFSLESLFAQSAFVPLDNNAYHFLERMEIKSGELSSQIFTGVKPYTRMNAVNFAEMIDSGRISLTTVDRKNLYYIFSDNGEWYNRGEIMSKRPILKELYQTKADLFSYVSDAFSIKINPELYFMAGTDPDSNVLIAQNTRGANIRGWIDKKIGFYADVQETQALEPPFVQQRINEFNVIPNAGRFKPFHTRGVDYTTANGYFDFTVAKYITVQFGQDKNFIGDGYRSLFLSDYSNNYLFLKLITQVWKFNYENLFMQLTPQMSVTYDTLYPKKYAAIQHLSINLTKFLNVGLFDAIVYTRTDHFDFSYLNPIIFYRTVEYGLGSPDNALIGLDYKANFLRHFSLYGQILLDDYNFAASRVNKGYWGDKYGIQFGGKWIDVENISNLDIQLENNFVRPYTYSHDDLIANYTNYYQALADPLGANFDEWIGIIRYEPVPNLFLTGKVIAARFGSDTGSANWGGNIFLSYNVGRPLDYGTVIGQGVRNDLLIVDITASYMLRHNLSLDIRYTMRDLKNALSGETKTSIITLALRFNLEQVKWDY